MDVVRLGRKERLVRLVGRLEPVASVELYGGTAGSSGDVKASGAARARETSDLCGEQRPDALAPVVPAHVESRQVRHALNDMGSAISKYSSLKYLFSSNSCEIVFLIS